MKHPQIAIIAMVMLLTVAYMGCVNEPAIEQVEAGIAVTPPAAESTKPAQTAPAIVATEEPTPVEVKHAPTIVGKTGGECDKGPTAITAAPEVAQKAQPGTLLHYGPVSYINYAAELNKWATEDCAFGNDALPVYYTLHINDLDELRAYGQLAKRADDFKLDRIMQMDVVPSTPVLAAPTLDVQATIEAAINER